MKISRMIELLREMNLTEEQKEIILFLQRVAVSSGRSKVECCRCKRPDPEDYMLEDRVWEQVTQNKEDIYCLSCVEAILHRNLISFDFKPLRMNGSAVYFLKRYEDLQDDVRDFAKKILKK